QRMGILAELGRRDLDGDALAAAEQLRLVDRAEPSLGDPDDDAELPVEHVPGRKRWRGHGLFRKYHNHFASGAPPWPRNGSRRARRRGWRMRTPVRPRRRANPWAGPTGGGAPPTAPPRTRRPPRSCPPRARASPPPTPTRRPRPSSSPARRA